MNVRMHMHFSLCERDPLNGPGRSRSANVWIGIALLLLATITISFVFETSAHVINQCPLSHETRAHERDGWRREAFAQELLRQEWEREKQNQNNVRQEWEKEVVNHLKLQEEQRKVWELEEENHRRTMDEQRLKWEQELQEHDRLEKERRQKMNMFWGQVEGHQCTTYATRQYTALLKNLPIDYPYRVEACKETLLEIHGASYLPKECEDKVRAAHLDLCQLIVAILGPRRCDWTVGSRPERTGLRYILGMVQRQSMCSLLQICFLDICDQC